MNDSLTEFSAKSQDALTEELIGFPPDCLQAILAFQKEQSATNLRALLPSFISFHLPAGVELPSQPFDDKLQLVQDMGLDSLALSEMAFKMEDVFGFRVESQEVFGIETFGDLVAFLSEKLNLK